jgi:hypothetical protein
LRAQRNLWIDLPESPLFLNRPWQMAVAFRVVVAGVLDGGQLAAHDLRLPWSRILAMPERSGA